MKSRFILPGFTALSMLLAAYGPMATYASAQAATDAKVTDLKSRIEKVVNQRIQGYKDTLKSLDVNVQLAEDSSSGHVKTNQGGVSGSFEHTCKPDSSTSPSPSASASPSPTPGAALSLKNGQLVGSVELGCGIKNQVKSFLQGIVTELTHLLGNVQGTNSLSDLQNLGKNVDQQFNLGQLSQLQGVATQSISSLTGMLDNLKTTWNDMHTAVTQMKDCAKTIFGNLPGHQDGSTTSPSPSATPNNGANVSVDSNGVNVDCGKFNMSSASTATQAENLLNAILPIIQQIGAMLLSAVVQMAPMLLSFTSMLGMMGGMSSLTSGGGLGSSNGLSMMAPMLTMLPMMILPLTSMVSQLGLANGMGGNALGSLGSLGSLVGI